ncbi:643_t:CDS:2, partial [Cetraspora pellucida]
VFTNQTTTIAYQRIFHTLFDLILQLIGQFPQFKHIHETGWGCIVANLDYAQAQGLRLALNEIDKTKDWEDHLIYIFKSCQQKWVIASLNKCMSKIDEETWMISPNNTNIAESAHALTKAQHKLIKNKRRKSTKTKKKIEKKSEVITIDSEDLSENNFKETSKVNNLEYQERRLTLKERELDLREREAKIHSIELANLEKKQKLKSTN